MGLVGFDGERSGIGSVDKVTPVVNAPNTRQGVGGRMRLPLCMLHERVVLAQTLWNHPKHLQNPPIEPTMEPTIENTH